MFSYIILIFVWNMRCYIIINVWTVCQNMAKLGCKINSTPFIDCDRSTDNMYVKYIYVYIVQSMSLCITSFYIYIYKAEKQHDEVGYRVPALSPLQPAQLWRLQLWQKYSKMKNSPTWLGQTLTNSGIVASFLVLSQTNSLYPDINVGRKMQLRQMSNDAYVFK